ncbi:MAG: hypothetical protein P1P93_05760 [Gammaproteobacteria bacterium]|nr:hypothetical protein [Gammaproteobacteria bacterium]
MAKINQQSGYSLIGWLGLMPFILLGVLVVLFLACELNKTYWDYRINQMCEEDGGVEIYQHIDVTPEEYAKLPKVGSGIDFGPKKSASSTDILYAQSIDTKYRHNLVRIRRTEVKLRRITDDKIIASYIRNSRIGGDFPTGIGHNSSYSCPTSEYLLEEKKNIFIIKEK